MILNQQRQVRVPLPGLNEFLRRACHTLKIPPLSLTVCLVNGAKIARWNRVYRGKKGPTDVLSFGSGASVASLRRSPSKSYLGDIAICPVVARRNARRLARTLDSELRILILHGILHLMGYDHERDSGQMERRERRLRRQLGLG
jgi:probable rRNA maturation factor